MTLNSGGRRYSKVSHTKWDGKGSLHSKKLKKSAELFAVLEFLRNLRDAGVGTNHTENIAKEINDETKTKIGGKDNLMDKDNCHRDVD